MVTAAISFEYKQNPYSLLLISRMEERGVKFVHPDKSKIMWPLIMFQADVVHVQWLHNRINSGNFFLYLVKGWAYILFLQLLKACGKGICWTVHNIEPHDNNHPKINIFFSKKMASLAASIIAMTNWEKMQVCSQFGVPQSKVLVAAHPNYIGYYEQGISKMESRKKLKIKSNAFVFLFLGKIREYKGVEGLIVAFSKIREEGDCLLIAGNPIRVSDPRELVGEQDKNSVMFDLNHIPNDALQVYFAAADVCVFPYKRVTNSGSLLLAMSFSKPVICPDIGCFREVANESFAILYKEGELEKALIRAKKSGLEKMGKAAYAKAMKYSQEEWADVHLKAYMQSLKNGKNL